MTDQNKDLKAEMLVAKFGKDLIYNTFVLLKTVKNYDYGHSALNIPIIRIMNTIGALKKQKEDTTLNLKDGYLFLGEQRLKPDKSSIEPFNFTISEMKRHFIGSINFLDSVTQEHIGRFASIFGEVEPIPSPQTFNLFKQKINDANIVGIEIKIFTEKKGADDGLAEEDNKAKAKKLYAKTLHAVSEVMSDVKVGQSLKLRKSKRVIQGMIDQLLTAETNLLGLTTIRCHDEYTYHHSVNVCILSLSIGQRIGLDKPSLCDLGIAALFHDIGKSDIPINILNKPSSFTEEEWKVMKTHPLHGVKALMKLKGLDALNARIITGAFEHHINLNHSGYPKVPYKRDLSLFGRIIAIADCYDGVTSSRVYSRSPLTPDKALRFMMDKAGSIYDPVLMKLFINSVGIYPVGSLLLLTTKEMAVVMQTNPTPDLWNSPLIKLISDASGNAMDGITVDLADPEEKRKISRTIDPEKHNIDVSRYFL